jgi:small subunit ribosomal protein S21
MSNRNGTRVFVKDGNVEKALRKLKKKVQRNNTLQEVKERQSYVQPSQKRKAAKEAAKRRWAKHVRSQQLPTKPRGTF